MGNKKRISIPLVGGNSLLVIFAVLCLTVFALLSLSTVLANRRLSEASVKAVSSYYEADCQAEEIFARLRNGEMPDMVTETNGIYAYTCPISETQVLQVEILQENDEWKVLRWQAVTDVDITEGGLAVWDGAGA